MQWVRTCSVTAQRLQKRKPLFREEKKNEIISRNCLPHHTTASRFINTAKQARLHLLSMLSRYYEMSESVQRDDHRSSFHDMLYFRYDEHRPALHVESLSNLLQVHFWRRWYVWHHCDRFLVGTGDHPLVSRRQVAIDLVACVKEALDMNCGLICLRKKLMY
jgi:hypothetical protein